MPLILTVNHFHAFLTLPGHFQHVQSFCWFSPDGSSVRFNSVLPLYVFRSRRLIRDGSPGRPSRLSHSSWVRIFSPAVQFSVVLRPQKPYGLLGMGSPGTAISTFTQLLSSDFQSGCSVQCCFTSTETIWLIRDGEPGDGHLDFHTAPEFGFSVRLFSSVLFYVHRNHMAY